ncbi:hypothetical protein BDF21DRAFT_379148 [Thamnidium elegans]|nr:hypothetical protein BDF21DRAFT_379148 [Thamnidium elegans]
MPKSAPSLSTYTTMMRVNSKGRPYAKDLYDLYSALLIQQPLSDHRSLFRHYPSTFTTDEAVESLGRLQFTHLVSTPNPLDPSQPLLTRTTTTFSMSRDMAKILGQHFLNARLSENATDPQNRTMKDRGIWAPTPKGKFMIHNFSQRARVPIQHMQATLSKIHNFQIVLFERLLDDDQLSFSRPNMTQAFKVMMEWLPTDNLMIDEIGGVDNQYIFESYRDTFFGYQCFEWIMEYTSVVSNEEAESIAAEFVLYGWIQQVLDKSDKDQCKKDKTAIFKTGRKTQYYLTDKGRHTLEVDIITNLPQQQASGTGTLTAARSRTHSSTSSSNSSITTNNSSNKLRSTAIANSNLKKEEHLSRLLPTTAESPPDDESGGATIIPKAIITKRKTISGPNESAVIAEEDDIISKDSMLQIDNNSCDFGFSSASSTTSSTLTPSYQCSTPISKGFQSKSPMISSTDSIIHEQLERLRIAVDPTPLTIEQSGSQHSRLQSILKDPLIRMYFRQFLKSSFCEENINFWVDYSALIKKINPEDEVEEDNEVKNKKRIEQLPKTQCHSLLNHCHVIYNTYFCPENAPSELNIDHGLRYDIIQYMQATFASLPKKKEVVECSSAGIDAPFGSISVSSHGILTSSVARDGRVPLGTKSVLKEGIKDSPPTCLCKIIHLYDLANSHVCKTMAQDSVPRFIRTEKYRDLMRSYYLQQNPVSDSEEEDE